MSDTSFVPIDVLDPVDRERVIEDCQSQACVDAEEALAAARNDAIEKCGDYNRLESLARTLWGAATAMALAAASTAAAGAALLGIPEPTLGSKIIAAALFIVAAILIALSAALAIAAAIVTLKLIGAADRLEDSEDAFNTAVADVRAACPIQCRPDLGLPSCA